MAILQVSRELYQSEVLKMAFKFLRKEHKACISRPKDKVVYIEYYITGEGIPKGAEELNISIKEVVPQVISILVI